MKKNKSPKTQLNLDKDTVLGVGYAASAF